MTDYMRLAEMLERDAINLWRDQSGWKNLKKQNGVQMFYKPSPHFKGNMYKFTAEIDESSEKIYDIMKPPLHSHERLSWDKSIAHYERLQTINDDLAIGLITTSPVMHGMISAREFIDLYSFKSFENMSTQPGYRNISWIFAKSVDFPNRPITKEYVRASNYPAGYSVAEHSSNRDKCFLELFVNCDIGGMIPRYLVESALPSQQVAYIQSIKAEAHRRAK